MDKDKQNVRRISVIFRYPNAKGLFVETPGFKPGGAPIQMYSLATELAKDTRYDVSFWVDGEVPTERIEGVRLISAPELIQNGVPIVSRFINNARKKDFDALFANSICIFTVADGSSFPSYQNVVHSLGGKTIYRVASNVDVCPNHRGSDGTDAFSSALKQADGVIVQTEYQQEKLRENFELDSVLLKSSFRMSNEGQWSEKYILWVGQSWNIKRPWIVLEIARRFAKEKFVMIMPPTDADLANAIKDEAEKVTNLTIIDYVEFSEIQRYFNGAKLVLNTSVHEGFPNTIHQAAMGKAPYVSLSWDANNYLEKNGVGACAHNDVNKMVGIINDYLLEPSFMHATGERAYQNFRENHDVSVVIEDLKAMIRNVAMIKS